MPNDDRTTAPPPPLPLPIELELRIFNALEALHVKVDATSKKQDEILLRQEVHAKAVTKYADDMLEVKQRQNRHGRKIREERRAREALEVWLGYPHTTAPRPMLPVAPAPPSPWQPRPPSPSRHDWEDELEDTKDHDLSIEETVRVRDIVARDRKDSSFYRGLPRSAFMKGLGLVLAVLITITVTAAITRLLSLGK